MSKFNSKRLNHIERKAMGSGLVQAYSTQHNDKDENKLNERDRSDDVYVSSIYTLNCAGVLTTTYSIRYICTSAQ